MIKFVNFVYFQWKGAQSVSFVLKMSILPELSDHLLYLNNVISWWCTCVTSSTGCKCSCLQFGVSLLLLLFMWRVFPTHIHNNLTLHSVECLHCTGLVSNFCISSSCIQTWIVKTVATHINIWLCLLSSRCTSLLYHNLQLHEHPHQIWKINIHFTSKYSSPLLKDNLSSL